MVQVKPIARVVGILLVIIGAMMWTGLPISWFYRSGDGQALLRSGLISAGVGDPLWWWGGRGERGQIRKREGYLIV